MTCQRIIGFLIVTSFLCGISKAQMPSQDYDHGCQEQFNNIFNTIGWLSVYHGILPTCTDGGLWKHVQCTSSHCYCVYVDTGKRIDGVLTYIDLTTSTYAQLLQLCPVRTETPSGTCNNPPLNYPCDVEATKYVYNPDTMTCDVAPTGCHGYTSLDDCEGLCVPRVYDECSFPVDRGQYCDMQDEGTRYRHNTRTGRCESFIYRGCGGNSNNYQHIWGCQRACVAQEEHRLEIVVDSARTYNVVMLRWLVDKYDLVINASNDVTEGEFEDIREHAESIQLTSVIATVTDEPDEGARVLIIGGGNSNQNQIPQEVVQRTILPREVVCAQEAKTGMCRGFFPKWFFDAEKSVCVKFIFGGCDPNGNNFQTPEECTEYCQAEYTPSPLEAAAPPGEGAGNRAAQSRVLESSEGSEVVYRVPTVVEPQTIIMSDRPTTTMPTNVTFSLEGSGVDDTTHPYSNTTDSM